MNLIIQFSPFSHYFIPFKSRHSPQHFACKCTLHMFYSLSERTTFPPQFIQNLVTQKSASTFKDSEFIIIGPATNSMLCDWW